MGYSVIPFLLIREKHENEKKFEIFLVTGFQKTKLDSVSGK